MITYPENNAFNKLVATVLVYRDTKEMLGVNSVDSNLLNEKRANVYNAAIKLSENTLSEKTEQCQSYGDVKTGVKVPAVGVYTRITNGADYLQNFFQKEIEESQRYTDRKTGFDGIDERQIFKAGLYVIAAVPACGKTTFCWQLLNHFAQRGEHCIYCSYEMSRLELFNKSVVSTLFQNDERRIIEDATYSGEWNHAWNHDEFLKTVEDLKNGFMRNLDVFELSNETIDDLLELLRPVCKKIDKPPVVCIDYLQIMPTKKDTDKRAVDEIVRKLKEFQRETNTTFIVISSLNRASYNKNLSFESLKESGGIEYSADVVWTMQQLDNDYAEDQPRKINLKCLKNRNGSNYEVTLKYFSAYDYFKCWD